MSLKRGVAASYASQIYVAVVGLAATPLYLYYLGAEAYGLIGFYGALMAWFQLLDVGLSPVVTREVARHAAGSLEAATLWARIRAIECLFIALAAVAVAGLIAAAELVAEHWLNAPSLSSATLTQALAWMTVGIGLRFVSVLYRGVLVGLEQQVWLGGFNAAVASARALLVIPVLALGGSDPTAFFAVQLGIGLIELGVLWRHAYSRLPHAGPMRWWDLSPLADIWRFSAAIAFTGCVGIVITQFDRIILSGLLDLQAYGYFSLVTLAASAILLIGAPLGSALQPRLTRLIASGDEPGAHRLFGDASQLLAVLTVPAAIVMAIFPEALLRAWTGDAAAASAGAATLTLYALGNLLFAQLVLPYSLQFAYGRMRYHMIGNALLVALLIPAQVLAAQALGAKGAGACWLVANLLFALAWLPVALRRMAPGVLFPWYLNLFKMLSLATALALLAKLLLSPQPDSRMMLGGQLILLGALSTALLACFCPPLRRMVLTSVNAKFPLRCRP